MASSSIAPYRDDEILVDREGIPHYQGAMPSLMKEHRRRVIFAYSQLEGEGKDEAEESRDLEDRPSTATSVNGRWIGASFRILQKGPR